MSGAKVKLVDVTVVFNKGTPNETVALRDINLEVPAGQIVIIQGGNGSGKSTLLKVIAGICQPTEGQVFIDGKDVTSQKDYLRARQISYVHQDPLLGTAPSLTLFENLVLTLAQPWWLPLPYGLKIERHQSKALESTGLGLAERLPVQLTSFSGGQRQAIAIGMAFSRDARLLLLDEFTASLAQETSRRIAHETFYHAAQNSITTMIILHDIKTIGSFDYCKVILERGRLS